MNSLNVVFAKKGKTVIPCTSVTVTYESKDGSWRGFVLPYDITYEAESRTKVIAVLKEMTVSYEEGLKKYNSPSHLIDVPLSCEEDINTLSNIAVDLVNKLKSNQLIIDAPNYYAEAIPA